jgi:hypothetical protein
LLLLVFWLSRMAEPEEIPNPVLEPVTESADPAPTVVTVVEEVKIEEPTPVEEVATTTETTVEKPAETIVEETVEEKVVSPAEAPPDPVAAVQDKRKTVEEVVETKPAAVEEVVEPAEEVSCFAIFFTDF